jgi:hypothetical protein
MKEQVDTAEESARQKIATLARRRLGFTLAGLGLGGVLAYLVARRTRSAKRVGLESRNQDVPENVVDDRGTTQHKAAKMLLNLRDRGFEADDEKVAVALGRTAEEFQAFSSGLETIDDDVIMKARGLAMHRNIQIE